MLITIALPFLAWQILAALGPISAVGIESTLIDVSVAFLIQAVRVIVACFCATVSQSAISTIHMSTDK